MRRPIGLINFVNEFDNFNLRLMFDYIKNIWMLYDYMLKNVKYVIVFLQKF